jgi:histidinol-phosphatase
MVQPDLSEDLAFAHELADAAATVTLGRFGDRLPVELKGDDTPVTEVDLAAEQVIRKTVATRFPGDGVLGEEGGFDEGTSGRVWVVDPVDGTKLFAEAIPLWTTLIALQVHGDAVLGVADAPAMGERYHAVRGGGAWCGDRRLAVSRVEVLSDAFVAHSPVEEWIRAGHAQELVGLVSSARGTRGLSDAWGHLLVAQGSMEGVVEHEPCYAWDWSATGVIVQEAGGRITTRRGEPPVAGEDLMVTNGRLHDAMMRSMREGSTDAR